MLNCHGKTIVELLDGTFIERQPPECLSVQVIDETTILVDFNEPMNLYSLTDPFGYELDPALEIRQITVYPDQKRVRLTTEYQQAGIIYTLQLNESIKDRIGNSINSDYAVVTFMGKGTPIDTHPPLFLNPQDGAFIKEQEVLVRWHENSDATEYELEIATDSTFTSHVGSSPYILSGSTTELTLELVEPRTYYARIRTNLTPANTWTKIAFERLPEYLYVFCPADQSNCNATDRCGNLTKPYESINKAIRQANALGMDGVKVAARGDGIGYTEIVKVVNGVDILGGYTPSFKVSERDWSVNKTIIQNDAAHVLLGLSIHTDTLVQGLHIKGKTTGAPVSGSTHTVFIHHSNEGMMLDACNITNGNAEETSYAVYVLDSGTEPENSPVISNCTIHAGETQESTGGILLEKSAARITGNTIYNGIAATYSIGVKVQYNSALITGNHILCKTNGASEIIGIWNEYGGSVLINNNVIEVDGNATNLYGVYSGNYSYDRIVNNTIITGDASTKSYCVYLYSNAYPSIINNILVSTSSTTPNRYGIGEYIFMDKHPVHVWNNAIAGVDFLYQFDATVTAMESTLNGSSIPASGNLGPDTTPVLVSVLDFNFQSSTDYHLTSSTPLAIRTGGMDVSNLEVCGETLDSTCGAIITDFDGQARSVPYSIGAFERN